MEESSPLNSLAEINFIETNVIQDGRDYLPQENRAAQENEQVVNKNPPISTENIPSMNGILANAEEDIRHAEEENHSNQHEKEVGKEPAEELKELTTNSDEAHDNTDDTTAQMEMDMSQQAMDEATKEIQKTIKETVSKILKQSEIKTEVMDTEEMVKIKALPMSCAPQGQFPFYGCAVCNISYLHLKDLDNHVVIHKNRVTSWDLRVQSLKKKRKLRKAKKLKLKLEKIKTENDDELKMEEELERQAALEMKIKQENDEVGPLEKIFKCAGCYKQFSLSYYLKIHVRSHTGEKPYQCSECGLAFITASKLGRHRRMHSMTKFECRICHKLFSRFDTLTRHFDKKHEEDKLEGEPYDYNAILPYLKELEDELHQKSDPMYIVETVEQPTSEELDIIQPKEEDTKPESITEIKIETIVKIEQVKDDDSDNGFEDTSFEQDSYDIVVYDNEHEGDEKSPKKGEKSPKRGEKSPKTEIVKEENDKDIQDLVKDEDATDNEDYFPIDAWTTPNIEISEGPFLPTRTRGRKKNISYVDESEELDPAGLSTNPLQCRVCGKHIKTPTYLRIHMRTHTGERPFKCYICDKGFITSSKMNRHVLTHIDEDAFDSKIGVPKTGDLIKAEPVDGDEANENKDEKEKPKRRKIKKRNLLPKSYIDQILTNLPTQPKKKHKPRPYSCDYCKKRFLHVETLQVHLVSHKGEEIKPCLSCHFCLTEFPTTADLDLHVICHTGPSPYLCTICGKTYKRKETMVFHRKMHETTKRYQCEICSKSFIAPCKLQRHLVSHRPDKYVIRYECPVCAHIFNTKYHIEMHLTTHEKDGLILEENRGQVLAMVLQNARRIPVQSESPLSNLKDLIPSDERSRICNICGEIFHHFYYLEEHLKTHGTKFNIDSINDMKRIRLEEAERKYKCPVCQKGFKLHYYLKLHSFTHTKEKPFMCQQCGKGFITKGKLKRHLESHTGLKKFQCHICYKFFTRPSYLRIHVKTIHGKAKDGYSISMPLASTFMGHETM